MTRFAWRPIRVVTHSTDGYGLCWTWLTTYWRGSDGFNYHCKLCDPAFLLPTTSIVR